MSHAPQTALGVINGRLQDCPASPNCVCSCTDDADRMHAILPLTYKDDWASAKARLLSAVMSLPRTRIIADDGNYLRFQCVSLVFRFIDDLEFLADPATGTIHVRSASRVGYSDLGVNRQRVEQIRAKYLRSA